MPMFFYMEMLLSSNLLPLEHCDSLEIITPIQILNLLWMWQR